MTPRTYLFVPGHRPERFDKALASGADAVVLDLEDAVAPADKATAREHVGAWLRAAGEAQRQRVVVRVNDEAAPWFDADLALLQTSNAPAVMLPKAERADTVARLLARCPDIAVLALIETARGVLDAEALAAAPGVRRLVFGTIDFALDLGLSGAPEGFLYAASRLALASRAAGLPPPVAGVTPEIGHEDRLLADLAQARAHGFNAKLCIHPTQVAPIHRALAPTEAELAWARRVIAAVGDHPGAVQVDGRMVDRPVLERARAVLALHHSIAGDP
jgi:citrate lyase subunit beta/citryl-CoA lyase